MRIAILSGGHGFHVHDLIRAGIALGHHTHAVDFRAVHAVVIPDRPLDPFADDDAVLVRTMPPGSLERIILRMDCVHIAHTAGKPILNPPRCLETCIDKYLALARLAEHRLPVPDTIVCQQADQALEAFHVLAGDVVVKPLFGSEGRGLMRLQDPDHAWRVFHSLEQVQAVMYIQRFVRHPGWDVRAFVLGGRVIAAMRRHNEHDWRSNVARGGRAEPFDLATPERELAVRAADAVGAFAAGVDLLPGDDGIWYIPEVNGVPGWKAISQVCDIDIASRMIRFLTEMNR